MLQVRTLPEMVHTCPRECVRPWLGVDCSYCFGADSPALLSATFMQSEEVAFHAQEYKWYCLGLRLVVCDISFPQCITAQKTVWFHKIVDMPVFLCRQVVVETVLKTGALPQFQYFVMVVDAPVVQVIDKGFTLLGLCSDSSSSRWDSQLIDLFVECV